MRNKKICLELKMDRVFYFAARGETDGGWRQMDRRELSSICSSSPSRLLHCWCLRFHCWVLLQGSATTQGGNREDHCTDDRLHGESSVSAIQQKAVTVTGGARRPPHPPRVSTWKLLLLSFRWPVTHISWQQLLKRLKPSLPNSSERVCHGNT